MRLASYRHYLLAVLTVVVLVNTVDRVAIAILLQEIKLDLHLSDVQLGLLTGIAFAFFYSVAGIPIARWADRGNRVIIIALATLSWSLLVSSCGLAGNFVQLLLLRMAVAVGEAGCIPPSHSLLADYFERSERPRVMAIYVMGAGLSGVLGAFFAGWLNEWYGWRVTFMILGLPGLLLAPLVWLTLREPRKAPSTVNAITLTMQAPSPAVQPSMGKVIVILWSNVTFRHLLFFLSVMSFFAYYGVLQWQPAFLIRSFGLTTGYIGTGFAIVGGIGLLGMYFGGEWASRHAARNESLQLKAVAVAVCGAGMLGIMTYLSSNLIVVWLLLVLATIALWTINGPVYATIQALVPERMRAVSLAILFMVQGLIGTGLGPLAAGALSEAYRQWAGEESLRYALLTLTPGYFWAAWHAWMASRTVASDVASSREWSSNTGTEPGSAQDAALGTPRSQSVRANSL